MNVLIWNENQHEKKDENVAKIYPEGIHGCLKSFLESDDINITTATLDDENCGITKEILENTDVLLWWGHCNHGDVPDEVALMVKDAVLSGMGAIFLHSAHHSKPFKLIMGTSCNLSWREDGDSERIWVTKPGHPILDGIDRYFDLPHEETYAEPFDIPNPDEVILISSYSGTEVFRAGCTFNRGAGKIFYFQPGHETFPTYYDENVRTVIKNAVKWVKPHTRVKVECPHIKKIED